MPTVSRGLFKWIFHRGACLEDFADRLNHVWTFGLLLLFAAIISWKQGVSEPIKCWAPAQFTPPFVDYLHAGCWNKHTIQYPKDVDRAMELLNYSDSYSRSLLESNVPFIVDDRTHLFSDQDLFWETSTTTTYYQWVPLFLVFQALLFKLPSIILYIVHGYSGLSFDKIAGLTKCYATGSSEERKTTIKQISRYIYYWCKDWEIPLPWRLLTCICLFTKFLFIVNICTQMSYLDQFLRTSDPPFDNSTSYGDVINDNLFSNNGSLWKHSPKFPREVFCLFSTRQLQNIQHWTVQCQLPMNEFTEVAYNLLWVWFLFVAIVTPISFVIWVLRVILPIFRRRYIRRCIQIHQDEKMSGTNTDLARFADWVGEDGLMVLKLIGANSSDLLVSEVVYNMWVKRTEETEAGVPGYRHITTDGIPLAETAGPQLYPPLNSNEISVEEKEK